LLHQASAIVGSRINATVKDLAIFNLAIFINERQTFYWATRCN
jgi:hypothetical protein